MAAERIAIIGGGSPYVPGIIYSFARAGEALQGSEIVLMDIDPSRLPMMTRLARRMAAEAHADLAFSSTTDLTEALEGATFVLTNFRPGGLEGLRLDEEIPDRHGIMGQETTGPGGTFYALRSIPQVLELCRRMEEVCPDAWMVNYVNPTNFVADAIRRRSSIKSMAICDGGGNALRFWVPECLGARREDVLLRAGGLNHHTWMLDLSVRGKDAYPLFREKIFGEKPGRRDEFALWSLEALGLYPCNPGYLRPYYDYDQAVENAHAGDSLYQRFMRDLPYHWPRFEAMAEGRAPIFMDPARHHTNVLHGDLASEIIVAIATNQARVFHVNVPNEGCFTNVPQGAIVEVPALVDKNGVRPFSMGALPRCVLGLTEALIVWQELSVDAALSGSVDTLLQALVAHPWVRSTASARQVRDEMLAAHAAFLPQFHRRS